MALKELRYERFRGKAAASHKFGLKNRVSGKNGTGKTTIKEAICFAFLGTDSVGTRNPQHLIKDGESSLLVEVTTDKAVISRTLTRKGSSTIKLTKEGVSHTLTQTQLESMLGSGDLFLSAFIPGYFLQMPAERQNKVVSEIQPKIDRVALFESLAGFKMTAEEKVKYNLSRRPDLVATSIATDRRDSEKEISMLEGDIRTLSSFKMTEEPVEPPEVETVKRLESLRSAWKTYRSVINDYSQKKLSYDRVRLENESRAIRLTEITQALSEIKLSEIPKVSGDVDKEVGVLLGQLSKKVTAPSFLNEVDTDNCPTCGQTVGLKHKERVRTENQRLKAEYDAAVEAATKADAEINQKISDIRSKYNKGQDAANRIIAKNRELEATRQKLLLEQAGLYPKELPEIGPEPEAPLEPFTDAEASKLKEASEVVAVYEEAKSQHNYVKKQIESSFSKIEEKKMAISKLQAHVERLTKMEEVMKAIPEEEMKQQTGVFNLDGVDIRADKEFKAFVNGIPYELLSTGERMKRVDIPLCVRINSLMAKPINMVFVDDANLMDESALSGELQVFAAEIEPGQEEVLIHATN